MNKILTKILDNYFTQKFIYLLDHDLKSKYNILTKFEKNQECIDIYLKPVTEKNFKFICSFKKVDSILCLLSEKEKFYNYISKFINELWSE